MNHLKAKKTSIKCFVGLLEIADDLAKSYKGKDITPKDVRESLFLTNQLMINLLPKQAAQIIVDMVYGDNIPKEFKR